MTKQYTESVDKKLSISQIFLPKKQEKAKIVWVAQK